MVKKIYTILVLISHVLFRKKHYNIGFFSEKINGNKVWYYDFKYYGFPKENLRMVSGADKLCEKYSNGKDKFRVNIIVSKNKIFGLGPKYEAYEAIEPNKESTLMDRIIYGREYVNINPLSGGDKMWICPVTLFVLGRYPKYIYIENGKDC